MYSRSCFHVEHMLAIHCGISHEMDSCYILLLQQWQQSVTCADIDWDNLRKQQAPKFLAPISKTGDDNAVDWELRSLAAALPHHGNAVGNVSGHAGHAGAQGMQTQDSGPDTNAYMAAAAQMHAIMRAENETNF